MYSFKKPSLVKIMSVAVCVCVGAASVQNAMAYEYEIKLRNDSNLTAGNEALTTGDVEKAIQSFSAALQSDLSERQLFNAHNGLCVAYNKTEDYFKALDHCDKAISLRKTYFGGYVNRGNVYLSLEKYDEAIENYQKANDLVPSSFIPPRNIEIANMRRDATKNAFPVAPELFIETCEQKPDGLVLTLN